jgi:hypothetical protein
VPVVSTPVGAEGLDLVPGSEIAVAETPEAFADAIASLLSQAGRATPTGGRSAAARREPVRLDADRRGLRAGAPPAERAMTAAAALLLLVSLWLAVWSYLLYPAWIRRLAARRPAPPAPEPVGRPRVEGPRLRGRRGRPHRRARARSPRAVLRRRLRRRDRVRRLLRPDGRAGARGRRRRRPGPRGGVRPETRQGVGLERPDGVFGRRSPRLHGRGHAFRSRARSKRSRARWRGRTSAPSADG